VLSAVAAAANGGSAHAGLAAGYQNGFLTAAFTAAGLALVTLVALPTVRPHGPARAAMH